MSAARTRLLYAAAGAVLAAATLAGCGLLPASKVQATVHWLTLPAAKSAELVVIVDQEEPAAMTTAAALLADTARTGEHVFLIGDRSGQLLCSSVAPAPPKVPAPAAPTPLGTDPTSFQKARYSQAAQQYQAALRQAQGSLRNLQQAELTTWTHQVVTQTEAQAAHSHAGPPNVAAALEAAATDLDSLRQSGSGTATTATIVITGISAAAAASTPSANVSLPGGTVVVADFPGTEDEEAGWQAALDQSGARRAVILTTATSNQLAATVTQGLDGAVTDTLTSVLFGQGSAMLEPAARPQLQRLLNLLTVTYPSATATIDGYTDSLPNRAPGGNLRLSLQRSLQVLSWLVAHQVPASRLEAVGFGDTDPVASNTPDGQPLNRRVVVIIDVATRVS